MIIDIAKNTPSKKVKGDSEVVIPFLVTVKQFCSQHPWPSESAMRAYIYRADELGMTKAFVRIGRRVLINVSKFFELVQNKGEGHE